MNDLQIFKNTEFGELGILNENGSILFPGTECAKALGYSNPHKAISDHCRALTKREVIDSIGRQQEMNFIPEGDLYRLIVRSKLPSAEKFERWVFDEVLPTIRKHGAYMTPEKIDQILADPDTIIKLATELKRSRTEIAVRDQIIGEMKPKADYVDMVLKSTGLMTVSQIAKDYGMSGQKLNQILKEKRIQYKQNGQWLLYAKYQDKSYTHSKTIDFVHSDGRPGTKLDTQWTQKGRLFIYEQLKSYGVYPMIERGTVA